MKIKEQIRAIMTDVKGEFVKDNFMKDTYFQIRQHNGKGFTTSYTVGGISLLTAKLSLLM